MSGKELKKQGYRLFQLLVGVILIRTLKLLKPLYQSILKAHVSSYHFEAKLHVAAMVAKMETCFVCFRSRYSLFNISVTIQSNL